ncbi:MAG: DNA repair protein, partial [Frankia sp.]|nr:DNA repair protein [Frankia sp.]
MKPALAWQGSLLDGGPPQLDLSFARLVRHRLDADSWVDHVPGWLSGSDELFAAFLDSSRWEQREMWMYDKVVAQPRLTAGWKPDET